MSDTIETISDDETGDVASSDRRRFLGKAAIAAAVTTVAGLSMSRQASAANGDVMNVGANETATATTAISGGTTLSVTDGSSTGIQGGVNPRVGSIYGRQTVSDRAGVMGEATGTSGGWGVYGRNSGTQGIGVYGLNVGSGGVGIYGEHRAASTESGTGVVGVSNSGTGVSGTSSSGSGVSGTSTGGVGVRASGSTFDVQASGTGRMLISANGVANPPAGASTVGTIAKDSSGNHWVCVASGTPGTWRKLAGPATAGAFHALTPGRVYDSRSAAPAPGTLSSGANRTISVANSRNDAGTVVTTDFVPAGATAVAANVTITNTVNAGFLTVNPGGIVTTLSSTINWFGNSQNLANGVTLTLNNNRELTIVAGGGGICDFIIDISGYYL